MATAELYVYEFPAPPESQPQLLTDVIQTLPLDPIQGELRFRASGIEIPNIYGAESSDDKEEMIAKYIKECEEAGVVPFRMEQIRCTWGGIQSEISDNMYSAVNSYTLLSVIPKRREAMALASIRGGRNHLLSVETDYSNGYSLYRDKLQPVILDRGYVVDHVNFTFNGQRDTEKELRNTDSKVLLKAAERPVFRLVTGPTLPANETKQLKDWFDELRSRHS